MSSVVAGIITAPSLIAASITSQSGDDVAEHQQHAVAAPHAEAARSQLAILVGPGGKFGETEPLVARR